MDPQKFIELAGRLARGNDVAEYRTAISRAYYGIYNLSHSVLNQMSFELTTSSPAHSEVEHLLNNSADKQVEKLAAVLGSLRTMRIEADYYMRCENVEKRLTAQLCIAQSAQFVKTLDQIVRSEKWASIVSAIEKYAFSSLGLRKRH